MLIFKALFFTFLLGIAWRAVFPLIFLLGSLFDDFEGGIVVDVVKVFNDQVLVKFLTDYYRELRLEFFVFDEFVEKAKTLWDNSEFGLFRQLSEDETSEVKDNSNAGVVVLVEVE